MRTHVGVVLALAIMAYGGGTLARQGDVAGVWSSADADDAMITLRVCSEGLCGEVVRQPRTGGELELVGGFQRLSDTRWAGGRVYNLNDGATYVVDIELIDPARLRVRGCWLGLCEIQLWRRVR